MKYTTVCNSADKHMVKFFTLQAEHADTPKESSLRLVLPSSRILTYSCNGNYKGL